MKLRLPEERWDNSKAGGAHVGWAAFLSFAFSFGSFSFGETKENERHVVRTMSTYASNLIPYPKNNQLSFLGRESIKFS
jgi:hypothetical protein